MDKPDKLAFPSWVIPGGVVANAAHICARWRAWQENGPPHNPGQPGLSLQDFALQPEIGLCFFEAAVCLRYGEAELPQTLSGLPCTWHVHLPLDLPICGGGHSDPREITESFEICRKLLAKVAFLDARRAVLHPPCVCSAANGLGNGRNRGLDTHADSLERFAELWVGHGFAASDLLIENQPGSELDALLAAASACGLGLCFDFAHLWMQAPLPAASAGAVAFASRAALWHLNAPGTELGGHAPLTALAPAEKELLTEIFAAARNRAPGGLSGPRTLMLELFKWEQTEVSLPVLLALQKA